jgi:hypothetical protein
MLKMPTSRALGPPWRLWPPLLQVYAILPFSHGKVAWAGPADAPRTAPVQSTANGIFVFISLRE